MYVESLGQYRFGGQPSIANLKFLLIIVVILTIVSVIILHFTVKKSPLIRRIISLSLLILGILSVLTGIVLLFLSSGQLVEESSLLGLARSDWVWWHTFTSILTIGFGAIHLYFNFDALKRYFGLSKHKNKT